jgi:hypothetical protein
VYDDLRKFTILLTGFMKKGTIEAIWELDTGYKRLTIGDVEQYKSLFRGVIAIKQN